MHFIYMVECSDGTFYTGYAKNVNRRVMEHNTSLKGAKYTRSRRPVVLRYVESFETRSDACKREAAIKKMKRVQKEQLILKAKKEIQSDEK